MKFKSLIFATLLFLPSWAQAEMSFEVNGNMDALYGYSDLSKEYEYKEDNNNVPTNYNLNTSLQYDFNEDYSASLNLDLMAGTDKELKDYNNGEWGQEVYGIVDSPYGRIMLGETYNVAAQFHNGAPNAGPVNNSSIVDFISNPNWVRDGKETRFATLNSSSINTDGVAPKVSYITPQIYNTMIGFTYVPDVYDRRGLIDKHAEYADKDAFITSIYNELDLGWFDMTSSLGYADYRDNDKEFSGSINLSRGNWNLGGGYRKTYIDGDEYKIGTSANRPQPELFDNYREGQAWDVGVGYEIGPYKVSLSYFNSKAENTDNQDEIIMLANNYQVTKNLNLYLIGAHVDFQGENDNLDNNNKGYAFVTGIGLSF